MTPFCNIGFNISTYI